MSIIRVMGRDFMDNRFNIVRRRDPITLAATGAALTAFFATVVVPGITVGSLAITLALSGASYLLQSALAPQAPKAAADQGQKLTVQQAVPSQRLIYGRALVGGPLFFYECKPPFLYLGIVLASHEIAGVDEFRIGDKAVSLDANGNATSTNFNNGTQSYVQLSIRTGTASQAIDPILAADFTELPSTFRQRGHATAVLKLRYGNDATDHEKYWGTGSPKPYFLVKGMKVYDPRKASHSTSDPTTWEWSDNSSLCLAHYLTFSKGCNRPWTAIDTASLAKSASDDDQQIQLLSGAFESRYSINGVVDTTAEPASVVLDMLTSNLGRLIWRDGSYTFISGVPRDAVWTLNDDSARGSMDARYTRPSRELVNTVRTTFTSPEREYQTANGPVLINAAYLAADGEAHEISITLPFTATHTRAQRIAKATMERARLGKLITRRESIEAIRLSAADIINIESTFLASLGMRAELNAIKLSADTLEVEIEAEQHLNSIYDWSAATDEQAFTIAPASLAGVN